MINKRSLFLYIIINIFGSSLYAIVDDSRFFPFFNIPYSRSHERPSRFYVDCFFMSADKGHGNQEEDVGLPEIFGFYDLNQESIALNIVGLPSPLLDEWRGKQDIPFLLRGKLQAQGISVIYNQQLTDHLSFSFSTYFMRNDSRHEFYLNTNQVKFATTSSDELELDAIRRQANDIIGLSGPRAHQTGFGDLDIYLRLGTIKDYILKCRRIDVGGSLGVFVPTGLRRNIFKPASVPFSGNGHWGIYGLFDGEFEVKEDMKVGIFLQLIKRLPKTELQRLPVVDEQLLYAPLVAPVRTNPGYTFIFNPYGTLENIREGFGAQIRYALTVHGQDDLTDLRTPIQKEQIPARISRVEERSAWISDYVTLKIFYDFGKVKNNPGLSPTLGLSWDIPALLFKASNIAKTHKASLSLEIHF